MLSEPNWPCRIWYDFIPPLSSEGVTPLVFSPSALFGTLGELSIDTHFVVLEFPNVAIVGDYPEVISTPKYIPVLSSNLLVHSLGSISAQHWKPLNIVKVVWISRCTLQSEGVY